MAEHPIQGLMGVTIDKIREMVDTSTIIGDPIRVDAATTIIPVSPRNVWVCVGGLRCGAQIRQADVWRRNRCRGIGNACGIPGYFGRKRSYGTIN